MEAKIPSQISNADLQKLYQCAKSDSHIRENQNLHSEISDTEEQEWSQEEIEKTANALVDQALDIIPDPIIHKAMALTILVRFIKWHFNTASIAHEQVSELTGSNELHPSTINWIEDGEKLKLALKILSEIVIGENDKYCLQ